MVELTWQGDVAVVRMGDGVTDDENRFDGEAVARWHAAIDEVVTLPRGWLKSPRLEKRAARTLRSNSVLLKLGLRKLLAYEER